MKTNDLFSINRKPKKLNESLFRIFGKKINLENFDLLQLQDARNKLRTQLSQMRGTSGFNENLENDAYHQAQFMMDAINAEIAERDENIVDSDVEEGKDRNALKKAEDYLVYMSDVLTDQEEYDLSHEFHEFAYELEKIGIGGVMKKIQQRADETGSKLWKDVYKEFSNKFGKFAEDFDAGVEEGAMKDVDYDLRMLAGEDEEELIAALQGEYGSGVADVLNDMMSELQDELAEKGMNDVMRDDDKMIEMLWDKLVDEYGGDDSDGGGETDDEYALASAGFGSDEDYGDFGRDESIQGETMSKITEGEVQQASAIVAAKTMVDRVGRWIEELSGMENDSLLQLGDQIRDEMGQEQAKNFISTVAPAISQALTNLKETREVLSTGVRVLTGEEQAGQMLGADAEGDEEAPAEPDAMNAEPATPAAEPTGDEFATAEPAAGGAEAAGREQRESVEFQNRLLRVLAG